MNVRSRAHARESAAWRSEALRFGAGILAEAGFTGLLALLALAAMLVSGWLGS